MFNTVLQLMRLFRHENERKKINLLKQCFNTVLQPTRLFRHELGKHFLCVSHTNIPFRSYTFAHTHTHTHTYAEAHPHQHMHIHTDSLSLSLSLHSTVSSYSSIIIFVSRTISSNHHHINGSFTCWSSGGTSNIL